MKVANFKLNAKHVAIGIVAICGIALAVHYIGKHGISLKEAREAIEASPAWIFLATLLILPPLGVPLSVFLVATGARFGVLYGSLAAIGAITAHHFIAIGLARLVVSKKPAMKKSASLWERLEKKTAGNTSKLLFLWGLIPGPPYSIKLYLPLVMGAGRLPYIKWCTLGHLIGTLIFVGMGEAILDGKRGPIIALAIIAIAVSVGLSVFRKKLTSSGETGDPPEGAATTTR